MALSRMARMACVPNGLPRTGDFIASEGRGRISCETRHQALATKSYLRMDRFMPISRHLWQFRISENFVPDWPCPGCEASSLTLVTESFRTITDAHTVRQRSHPDFDNEWVSGRFVCLLKCSKNMCKESCAVAGNFSTSVVQDEEGVEYQREGIPRSIIPAPPMIGIPEDCPKPVKNEVKAAFSLYWSDLAACLNRIRNALELVLNDLNVPKSSRNNSNGKMQRLSLHHRIEKLEKQRPGLKDICDRMMAVKHLGNAGSHPEENVAVDDVFDGFDILERVLADMYSRHTGLLEKTVREINRRKGPRKGRR
jgi:hypothetical protein